MNAVKFAEEFTQLIIRWTRPVTNGEGRDNLVTPLTNQQLVNAMQDVLQVMLGVPLQVPDYSTVKTPAVGIEVCTPNAPVGPKNHFESNGTLTRYKSLDMLISMPQMNNLNGTSDDTASTKSQGDDEPMDTDIAESTAKEKKFISKSSPAIHINSVTRSDTFIREEKRREAMDSMKTQGEEDNVVPKLDVTITEHKTKSQSLLQKIKTLRECAYDFILKIDDVELEVHPQTTKPIRRLSSIGGFPGVNRSSSQMRTVSSSKHRRSSRAFPATPTSSKLNAALPEKDDPSARRKTIGVVSTHTKSTTLPPIESKKSPINGVKPAKNAKYAHVQSTIPKATVSKKKTEQN